MVDIYSIRIQCNRFPVKFDLSRQLGEHACRACINFNKQGGNKREITNNAFYFEKYVREDNTSRICEISVYVVSNRYRS